MKYDLDAIPDGEAGPIERVVLEDLHEDGEASSSSLSSSNTDGSDRNDQNGLDDPAALVTAKNGSDDCSGTVAAAATATATATEKTGETAVEDDGAVAVDFVAMEAGGGGRVHGYGHEQGEASQRKMRNGAPSRLPGGNGNGSGNRSYVAIVAAVAGGGEGERGVEKIGQGSDGGGGGQDGGGTRTRAVSQHQREEKEQDRERLLQESYWGKEYARGRSGGGSPRVRGYSDRGGVGWSSPPRPTAPSGPARLSVDLINVDPVKEAVKQVSPVQSMLFYSVPVQFSSVQRPAVGR